MSVLAGSGSFQVCGDPMKICIDCAPISSAFFTAPFNPPVTCAPTITPLSRSDDFFLGILSATFTGLPRPVPAIVPAPGILWDTRRQVLRIPAADRWRTGGQYENQSMDYTVILPKLYLGPCPKNVSDVDSLRRDSNITAVLNVQTDDDMHYFNLDWPAIEAHYQSCQIEVRRVPVRDFDELDLRDRLVACVNALNDLMQSGHNVYVHCSVGAFRSPSVVIAYLHW